MKMILLGHCPDTVGLVAKISGFFANHGVNITTLEEHTEQGRFFIRVATEKNTPLSLLEDFLPLANEIQMEIEFFGNQNQMKLLLFCSGTFHCPLEVISRCLSSSLFVDIVGIVSNKEAFADIAKKMEIPFFYTPVDASATHEKKQLEIIDQLQPDLIALGRYMRVLSSYFLEKCEAPLLNIHHSFLPSFVGGNPYEMAFERGVKIVGATAHFVTEGLDEGPIIAQDVLPIGHALSAEEMKRAGANIEKLVFADAIEKFSQRKIIEYKGRTIVFS